jgi:DNA-directed RNA polymerase specialized sigma24 family protein
LELKFCQKFFWGFTVSWFIERKTSSFWEEGERRSRMTQDATGILEPFRKYFKVLAELPETMREVMVLKHCQGGTLTQIAKRIGRSVPSVASLLRRGLEDLRICLKTGE